MNSLSTEQELNAALGLGEGALLEDSNLHRISEIDALWV